MRAGRGPQNWDVRAIPLHRRAGRRIGLFGGQGNSGSFYNHIHAADACALIGEDVWKRYFKFAISRNPWDRQISIYYWLQQNDATRLPFNRFMRREDLARKNNFSSYSINGIVAVDRICRYEALRDEVQGVLAEVGIEQELTLPRAKSGLRKTKGLHYRDYYDDETREIVARWYACEIEVMGYTF